MSRQDLITEQFDDAILLPACGQGALGIESRTDDKAINQLIAPLHHVRSAQCVEQERQVNALLGGNCHVPLAVYCQFNAQEQLYIQAKVYSLDGKIILSSNLIGEPSEGLKLAERCAQSLIEQGAANLLGNHS